MHEQLGRLEDKVAALKQQCVEQDTDYSARVQREKLEVERAQQRVRLRVQAQEQVLFKWRVVAEKQAEAQQLECERDLAVQKQAALEAEREALRQEREGVKLEAEKAPVLSERERLQSQQRAAAKKEAAAEVQRGKLAEKRREYTRPKRRPIKARQARTSRRSSGPPSRRDCCTVR